MDLFYSIKIMTIRRKTTVCGEKRAYMWVELFPVRDLPARRPRRKRYKESTPVQRELNDRHAKNYFKRLAESNFSRDDCFLTLTYDEGHMPDTVEEAEHCYDLFIRRVKRLAKKKGGKVKSLAVLERSPKGRHHHHVLVGKDCGLDREELEQCWRCGWCECKPVWENRERNVARLAKYMTKNMAGTRRWKSSRGLKKPQVYISDTAVSNKRYRELSLFRESGVECRRRWQQMYPGYEMIGYENYLNPEDGLNYIRVELRRRNDDTEGSETQTEKHKEHPDTDRRIERTD